MISWMVVGQKTYTLGVTSLVITSSSRSLKVAPLLKQLVLPFLPMTNTCISPIRIGVRFGRFGERMDAHLEMESTRMWTIMKSPVVVCYEQNISRNLAHLHVDYTEHVQSFKTKFSNSDTCIIYPNFKASNSRTVASKIRRWPNSSGKRAIFQVSHKG